MIAGRPAVQRLRLGFWWVLASGGSLVLFGVGVLSRSASIGSLVNFGVPVVLGLAQWMVLRHRVARAGWWIAATVGGWGGGWMLAVFLFVLWGEPVGEPVPGITFQVAWGVVLGLSQWGLLRRWARRAGWWIPAATVGWAVPMVSLELWAACTAPGADCIPWHTALWSLTFFQGTLLYGLVTALVLVSLFIPHER